MTSPLFEVLVGCRRLQDLLRPKNVYELLALWIVDLVSFSPMGLPLIWPLLPLREIVFHVNLCGAG